MSTSYLYRRVGHPEWATCSKDRYAELKQNSNFHVKVAYDGDVMLDALRWRAFINSARIRFFGHAGLNSDGTKAELDYYKNEIPDYVHFGGEFWTEHSDTLSEDKRAYAATVLTSYADAAIRAQMKQCAVESISTEEVEPAAPEKEAPAEPFKCELGVLESSTTTIHQIPKKAWSDNNSIQFESPYASPYFINTQAELSARLQDPFVWLYRGTLSRIDQIMPLLNLIHKHGRPLLVVADKVHGEALSTFVVNNMRGLLPCVVVETPNFSGLETSVLEKLAVLSGAVITGVDCEHSAAETTLDHLGEVRTVVVTYETTYVSMLCDVAYDFEPEQPILPKEVE